MHCCSPIKSACSSAHLIRSASCLGCHLARNALKSASAFAFLYRVLRFIVALAYNSFKLLEAGFRAPTVLSLSTESVFNPLARFHWIGYIPLL